MNGIMNGIMNGLNKNGVGRSVVTYYENLNFELYSKWFSCKIAVLKLLTMITYHW